jgi:cytochrome b561
LTKADRGEIDAFSDAKGLVIAVMDVEKQRGEMLKRRSHVTRVLHLALLLMVLHQLIGSQVMERPLPGDDPAWPFLLHQWIGVAGLVALGVFWVWTLARHRLETPLGRLVPWFSIDGWRAVFVDAMRSIGRLTGVGTAGGRPEPEDGALASAVHGLGLLVASAMAVSGAAYLFLFEGTSSGRLVLGLHKLFANFMWAYLIGHAGVAIVHAILGDDVLSRMFWLRSRDSSSVEAP